MSFDEVYSFLLSRCGAGCGAGPAGVRRLLKRLGDPQEKFKIIHVAGTNGKGSLCHLCAEMLQAAGHRTGLFVSPHLVHPAERIGINGRLIAKSAFARLCVAVLREEEEKLNFFEILTTAALLYFAQKKVHFAVLETGLGGRKDPTAACTPAVTAITSVGLDHCALLGGTLGQIAREKAGILKAGVPCFCGPLSAGALREVQKAARAAGAPLHLVQEGQPFTLQCADWPKARLLLQKGGAVWPLGVMGARQTLLACLAYQIGRFLGITDGDIKKAFARVHVPCRFEVLRAGKQTWVFDGAHNPPAIEAFLEFFAASPWCQNAALVCGFMQDKDYPKMLRLLAPHFEALYVAPPPAPRAASVQQMRAAMPKSARAFYFSTPQGALRAAQNARPAVAVCGSFYLAGRLRARKKRY